MSKRVRVPLPSGVLEQNQDSDLNRTLFRLYVCTLNQRPETLLNSTKIPRLHFGHRWLFPSTRSLGMLETWRLTPKTPRGSDIVAFLSSRSRCIRTLSKLTDWKPKHESLFSARMRFATRGNNGMEESSTPRHRTSTGRTTRYRIIGRYRIRCRDSSTTTTAPVSSALIDSSSTTDRRAIT